MPAPKPLLAGMLAIASLSGAVAHVLSPTPGLAQDARYRVEGIISDSNGVPLEGQQIVLIGAGDSQQQGGVGLSASDGCFVVDVPDGNHHLRVATRLGSQCTVSNYEPDASGWEAIVAVSGKDIGGLVLTVAGSPSDAPALLACSFLLEGLGRI